LAAAAENSLATIWTKWGFSPFQELNLKAPCAWGLRVSSGLAVIQSLPRALIRALETSHNSPGVTANSVFRATRDCGDYLPRQIKLDSAILSLYKTDLRPV
jgi:hypothetical protein